MYSRSVSNFGRNVEFLPKHHETAKEEGHVLQILERYRGHRIRAHGSLHSWSEAAKCDDVLIDVSQLNHIRVNINATNPNATIGAGCQIKQIVAVLNSQGWTTPTLGLIKEQTIAGATATATHGSGRNSLSHYISSLRLATYNDTGNPIVKEITEGEELRAACCSLGSMGVVTELTLPIRKQYFTEEHFRDHHDLQSVLAAEDEYPLQQFFFLPWKWSYLAQHRRETQVRRSWHARIYRCFWAYGMDHGLHWIILAIARCLPNRFCPFAFRYILPYLVPRGWRVIDRSDQQLTMQHQLYRHIETELFVRRSKLSDMLALTRWLIEWSSGYVDTDSNEWEQAIKDSGLSEEIARLRGCYWHHYPICVRKVLPDNGLITMSGGEGEEEWYSVSLISYAHKDLRTGFIQFASVITRLAAHCYKARPHWGKYYPSDIQLHELYPQLNRFMEIRNQIDPTNAFCPNWMKLYPEANAN